MKLQQLRKKIFHYDFFFLFAFATYDKKKLSFLLYCDKQKAIFLLQNKLLKISRDTNGCTITLHFTYNQLIILRKIIFCSNPYLVMCYFDVFTCTIVYPLSRRVLWAVTRTLKAIHDPRFLLVIFLLLCARIYETVAAKKENFSL